MAVDTTYPAGYTQRRQDGSFHVPTGGAFEVETGGTLTAARIFGSNGTAEVNGNVGTFTATWGANATAAIVGTDTRGLITISTNVADTAGAKPTFTFTFADGTFTNAPTVMLTDGGGTGNISAWGVKSVTATTVVVQLNGTPTATTAATFKVYYLVVG